MSEPLFFLMYEQMVKAVMPALVTVVGGGLFAAFLVPRWQRHWERIRLYEKRKLEVMEEISESFARYIVYWQRLITISEGGTKSELDEEEKARKQQFVEGRNSARDSLLSQFNIARVYFSEQAYSVLSDFRTWDKDQSNKPLNELPLVMEWEVWEDKILKALKQELDAPRGA